MYVCEQRECRALWSPQLAAQAEVLELQCAPETSGGRKCVLQQCSHMTTSGQDRTPMLTEA